MPDDSTISCSSTTPNLGVTVCSFAYYAGPFLGHMFLIVMDTFSKWLKVVKVSSATSSITIEKLRSIFATHGIPRILVTDNGLPLISSEFQAFMKNNGIKHIYSAPYHPATNGLVEWSVQTFKEHMKRLLVGLMDERFARPLEWHWLSSCWDDARDPS